MARPEVTGRKTGVPKKPRLSRLDDTQPINPDFFYRKNEGPKYFGYKLSQQDEKIKTGVIPKPVALDEDGRACGWFGKTILAWQAGRIAKAMRVAS
jgi:predicted DNA-binding transcriptional regulator AlpA